MLTIEDEGKQLQSTALYNLENTSSKKQEAFITNIDLTNGNERELLDNYWMPSISAGGKSAS